MNQKSYVGPLISGIFSGVVGLLDGGVPTEFFFKFPGERYHYNKRSNAAGRRIR